MASSNDTRRIQTNNLAPTPHPMTAALIFWRQLDRRSDVRQDFGPTPKTGIHQTQTGILVLD
jgi:hypothetical protein